MATRRNESRAWSWPWGKKKAARPAKAAKPVSAKAVAKQDKEREDERLERKMSDAQFETKLRKHYARGGNLREFLQANPGVSRAQFKRCAARNAPLFGKRNPSDEAAAVYEEFHGRPSEEVVTVKEKIHYHEHLAALGELRTLVVQARDGAKVTLSKFRKAILCTNEAKNQMFVRGGDQAVDLAAFGIKKPHEVETLGRVLELAYFTTKTHLGDEGGTAVYFHVTGETNENGKRKMAGWAPDLIYRVLDESLEFSGGSYSIRAEGVDR